MLLNLLKMQRWKKSIAIFSFLIFSITNLIIVNSQDYFGYNSYPLMFSGPYSGSPFGANAYGADNSIYEDQFPYYRPMRRSFGQPNGYANSHDSFDQEKTVDERISAKLNPLPYIFNPGVRRGITTLQQMEARKQQLPTRKLLPRNFFF